MEDIIIITIILSTIYLIILLTDRLANNKYNKIKINKKQIPNKYLKKTKCTIKSFNTSTTYTKKGIYISNYIVFMPQHQYFIRWNEIEKIKKRDFIMPLSKKYFIDITLKKENKEILIVIISDDKKDFNIIKEHTHTIY